MSFVNDAAIAYGIDLSTARRDRDGSLVADICAPMAEGRWEYQDDKGWVHVVMAARRPGDRGRARAA
jgi:hypothetical protein